MEKVIPVDDFLLQYTMIFYKRLITILVSSPNKIRSRGLHLKDECNKNALVLSAFLSMNSMFINFYFSGAPASIHCLTNSSSSGVKLAKCPPAL
jgi:hypothetical protein